MVRLFSILILLLSGLITNAQEDLFDLLDDGPQPTQFTYATFKGTKLLNGQTNETPGKGVLQYIISHRFGSFTDEYLYNFFGLDNAHIRMQLGYGISDRLNVGIGRSSVLKTSDAFLKYRALRQRTGGNAFPVSLTLYSSINYRGARFTDGLDHYTSDRVSYHHQAIFARKMTEGISLVVAPSIVHWNLVPGPEDRNDTYHLMLGGRYKLTKRIALTGEYAFSSNRRYGSGATEERFHNPLSVGVDIETGGHVFQFHLSNTRAMSDPLWMAQNPYSAANGSLFLGFNISRVFTVKQ
ncbi:DUF5777 family beta-barrel protein [Schleiferiaceae bacterium]|nr:DUF5777 family beta-barrel protein [Schleiferiaceae bacterium]